MNLPTSSPSTKKIRLVYLLWMRHKRLFLNSQNFKDEFFINNKWKFEDCAKNPDLVILDTIHLKKYELSTQLLRVKLQYGIRTYVVAYSLEAVDKNGFNDFDFSISMCPESENNFYLACWNFQKDATRQEVMGQVVEPLLCNEIPQNIQKLRSQPKKFFCNYIYSNSSYHPRFDGIRKRIQFCKNLSNYKQVDCAGSNLNNTNRLQILEQKNGRNLHQTLKYMSEYKFAIAFENQSRTGYITEKIWNAYMAGCIPIYWGSPNVAEYFNPETFINCHDYDNFEQVIERVRKIDNDPALYEQYMSAPIVLENSKLHGLSKKNISKAMDSMLNKVVVHRELWENITFKKIYATWLWSKFIVGNIHNFVIFVVMLIIRRTFTFIIKPVLIKFHLLSKN